MEEGLLARIMFLKTNADQLDTEETDSRFQTVESHLNMLEIPEDHMLWVKFYGINETRYFMQGNHEVWLDNVALRHDRPEYMTENALKC